MPEGDTVYRTAVRLRQALIGATLVRAELRWPTLGDVDLAGRQVVEILTVGKHLLMRLDSGSTLHSHLRMEGSWRIEASGSAAALARWRSPGLRAGLATATWTAFGLRLGMLDLIRTSAESDLIGHLGPDILDAEIDADQAVANLLAHPDTVGAALLDQRVLAGVGTLWACESLFLQRLGPWTPSAALSPTLAAGLVTRARRLMVANLDHAVQSSTGIRRHGETTWVHARSGRPCRRCGTAIRVAPIGPPTRERPMFYCPTCQGGLGATDDGRPIAPLGARRQR